METIFQKNINNAKLPFITNNAIATIVDRTTYCLRVIFQDDPKQQELLVSPDLCSVGLKVPRKAHISVNTPKRNKQTEFNALSKEHIEHLSREQLKELLC